MATFFKTPFHIANQHHYIEVKVPKIDATAASNIICCVDVSGSMSGAPIRNVCAVLKDIYQRTKVAYPLFTYNSQADTTKTIQSVEQRELEAGGGTSFSSIFNAIQRHLVANQKSTTFIFMTDGQDGDSQDVMKRTIQMLKLTIGGLPKTVSIVFHVIGFGEVNNNFLEQVRKFGNKDGLFRYSSQSSDLQNNFNDMFEYAMSAREFTIVLNNQSYTSGSNEDTVGFLIENINIDPTTTKEITFKTPEGESKIPLEPLENPRAIQIIRALNLVAPDNEETVRLIRSYLYTINPTPGSDLMEKLELEQIKKEIDERMMEYTKLFTEMKMGQVPEQVKLRLSALRHDVTFANAQRKKKLDLRINKNVEYFRKTDISGILDGYRKNLDQQGWNDIKQQKDQWVCTYSHDDIYEMMRKSSDNIMCLGILVERNEKAITNPTEGLKLISVSNTFISYDSFIAAMNSTKTQQNNYGQFDGVNDNFCVVGQSHEKINAVIPLYINYEHMKRIRILEGIWLGYLFTLDSYGYDKEQEIGLLKLLYDIILQRTNTTFSERIIQEFERVCHFIITESIGFKTAYGENTYENFLSSIHGRQNGMYDLCIPLMIGHLKKDLQSVLMPVYYEHIRRSLKQKSLPEKYQIIDRLVYGDESRRVKTVASQNTSTTMDTNQLDPDFVEKSFIDYFHDEMNQPIELIPETTTGDERKLVCVETEVDYVRELLQSMGLAVPVVIKNMLKYAQMDENYLENHLDYDALRKELLMILFFEKTVPNNVTHSNILTTVDSRLQGKYRFCSSFDFHSSTDLFLGDRSNTKRFHFTEETIRIVNYKLLTAKTLEGFGGLLRKYCPRRCGPVFTELIKNLLVIPPAIDGTVLNKEKLIALLTNQVGNSRLYTNEMAKFVWQPLADVDIDQLARIVGEDELKKIEKNNSNAPVLHCYRTSNKLNHHGYGNYNPNLYYTFRFINYRFRQ